MDLSAEDDRNYLTADLYDFRMEKADAAIDLADVITSGAVAAKLCAAAVRLIVAVNMPPQGFLWNKLSDQCEAWDTVDPDKLQPLFDAARIILADAGVSRRGWTAVYRAELLIDALAVANRRRVRAAHAQQQPPTPASPPPAAGNCPCGR